MRQFTWVFAVLVGLSVVQAASAAVTLYTDLATWQAAVINEEALLTTAANVALADEVLSPPAQNEVIPDSLTFNAANTGLSHSFIVSSIGPKAGGGFADFTFSDGEASPANAGFNNLLSPGDINNEEDDDWAVQITSGPVTAFGLTIGDSHTETGETIFLTTDPGGSNFLANLSVPDDLTNIGGFGFLGIISDTPFAGIFFNEDAGGDDIAIGDFRFADIPEPTSLALIGMAGLGLVARRR